METETKTIEEAEELLERCMELKRKAAPYASALIKLEQDIDWKFDEYEIEFEDSYGFIGKFGVEDYCTRHYDYYSISIPLSHLFEENGLEKINAEIKAKEDAEQLRKETAKETAKTDAAKKEYQKYLKMKEKFES